MRWNAELRKGLTARMSLNSSGCHGKTLATVIGVCLGAGVLAPHPSQTVPITVTG